jgi:thiol-disulfide isomerase/thioredoxin
LVIILAVSGVGAQDAPKKEVDPFARLIGKKAPELNGVFGINGRAVKLTDLRGKVVLIDFWAVWCGPCRVQFPQLNALHKQFRDEGLEVLGVTTYYKELDFDKKTGKLFLAGKKVEDEKTGKVEVVGLLTPDQENEMLRAFASYHKLKYHLITLSKENYLKSARDYAREIIPQSVLVDRLGVIRKVISGISEVESENLVGDIQKLLAER